MVLLTHQQTDSRSALLSSDPGKMEASSRLGTRLLGTLPWQVSAENVLG